MNKYLEMDLVHCPKIEVYSDNTTVLRNINQYSKFNMTLNDYIPNLII